MRPPTDPHEEPFRTWRNASEAAAPDPVSERRSSGDRQPRRARRPEPPSRRPTRPADPAGERSGAPPSSKRRSSRRSESAEETRRRTTERRRVARRSPTPARGVDPRGPRRRGVRVRRPRRPAHHAHRWLADPVMLVLAIVDPRDGRRPDLTRPPRPGVYHRGHAHRPSSRRSQARGALQATARAAAARRAHAAARPRGVRRAGPSRRRARAAATQRRPRPPVVDPAVGTSRAPARRASRACSRTPSAPTSSRSRRSCRASSRCAPPSPRRRTAWRSTALRTVLFLDEIHRFNKAQQDALLPHVEDGTVTLIGATTENPYFEVNAALLSRMRVWRLEALTDDEVATVVRRALADEERGLAGSLGPTGGVALADDAFAHLVSLAGGDARSALNVLEGATALAEGEDVRDKDGHVTPRLEDIEAAAQQRILGYDRAGDGHFDTASAFIKSLRGNDPDAALYWLADDDRGRRGPQVHRPAADHQRLGGRRERRPARAAGRGRGRPGASTGSGCPRRSTRWPRRPPTSRPPRSRTGRAPRTGRPSATSRAAAPCRCRSTCGTPRTAG